MKNKFILTSLAFFSLAGSAIAGNADFTLVKGQQIVDMEGDRVFR